MLQDFKMENFCLTLLKQLSVLDNQVEALQATEVEKPLQLDMSLFILRW